MSGIKRKHFYLDEDEDDDTLRKMVKFINEDEDNDTVRKMVKFINGYLNRGKHSQSSSSTNYHIVQNSQSTVSTVVSTGRSTETSLRISNENEKKKTYIQAILDCLKHLLYSNDKHIIEHSFGDDTTGFYILDKDDTKESFERLLSNPHSDDNGQKIGSTPKVVISFAKITPHDKTSLTVEHNKKVLECEKIMKLSRLHVGWVNGAKDGLRLLGTIAMFYGILKLILENPKIMFGELDDDTDNHTAYKIFGFNHLNTSSPSEASADFTNFEKMIDQVTSLICSKYPGSCECFEKAKRDFKSKRKNEGTRGGKRRTKKRTKRKNSKRRKTKRRRKY
jgi:hypothetical protein